MVVRQIRRLICIHQMAAGEVDLQQEQQVVVVINDNHDHIDNVTDVAKGEDLRAWR